MADEQGCRTSGRVLAQRYRLVNKLGEGGMGSVWRAEHLELGTLVAVKLISEDVAKNPEALARFRREAHAAAALRSPHVVQILDYGVDGETPFMVMELLDGESLADRLTRRGSLSLQETSRILSHVARAVSKAHSFGIVHRDLKPDNIFLVDNEDEEVAKVLDFGIAKTTRDVTGGVNMMTGTGVMLGTPYYMSPEQAAGKREVDHRTDTWALAVIAYQCLVGQPPFRAETIGGLVLAICTEEAPQPSQRAAVDRAFDAWFLRGIQRDPDRRFQTARELAESLRAVAEGHAQPDGIVQPALPDAPGLSRASVSGGLGASPASIGAPLVSTTAESTSLTQSVLEARSSRTSRSPILLAGALLLLLAGGGYAAYRGLGLGQTAAAVATSAPMTASEPAATPIAEQSQDEPAAAAPSAEPSETPSPDVEPSPEFSPAAALGGAREVAPVRATPRAKANRSKETASTKIASAGPEPTAAPVDPPKQSTPASKPSASPPKPATKPKIDLAF